jgi:hypothetical protein
MDETTPSPPAADPEREPYEPPAIEADEEFERLVLQCCIRDFPKNPVLNEIVAS